jgi:hypothetical protein
MKRALALVCLIACGGKIEEVSSSSGGGTTPTPTGTTTSVPPSPPLPGEPTATPAPTPPKDPTPTSKKVLTAQAVPGGRDHLMIFAADPAADSCIRLHLAYPSSVSQFPNVVVPKEWGVEQISRSPGAKRCGPGKQPPAAEEANDAKGSVAWVAPSGTFYPCSIDVHVSAIFGVSPMIEQIDGDKIAVDGCY